MTGHPPQDSTGRTTREPSDSMPPAFWAFHDLYHQPYFEYAHVQLGSEEDADDLVDATFVYLAVIWPLVISQENMGAYAWALLKERVASQLALQGREPAATETLAFERAIRAATGPLLDDFRAQFRQEYTFDEQITELEDSMRMFAAMARLPERQFDVMVLHYALDFDTKLTALVMGVCEATVRSTRRTAKRRLAAELGLAIDDDADEEE
ncbi:RNA polymerase sigma factor [Streptomyces torulosus]|uniref:RNA polymerase sigma factor n=1 Tax=Streptomyces torulosus TaxID=68276 RepID=UPI0006EB7E79|nr:sigma-70 family RNA polymerase sigma factor [Streptomyces torulosus]